MSNILGAYHFPSTYSLSGQRKGGDPPQGEPLTESEKSKPSAGEKNIFR